MQSSGLIQINPAPLHFAADVPMRRRQLSVVRSWNQCWACV